MPIEEKIVDNGLGYIMSGHGIVTGQDIIRVNELTSTDEQHQKYIYWLYDFSEINDLKVSSEEIMIVANQDLEEAKKKPDMVGAVVAPKDLIYGLVRMWEIYSDNTGWNVMVLRSRDEAETWIKKQLNMELTFM